MKLGKFYGIGVGPGDPGLLTLKAAKTIEGVPVVFAPRASDDSESLAYTIAKGHIDQSRQKVVTPVFPMSMDKAVLDKAWSDAAVSVSFELKKGNDVAFLTLGDPSLYSTYSYVLAHLKALLPGLSYETVPGVSSISLAAARAGVDLGLGQERLAVMPMGRDMDRVRDALSGFDTVVLMKVNRSFAGLVALLEGMGLLPGAVYVSRCGTDREKIIRDLKAVKDADLDYLSLVIIKTARPLARPVDVTDADFQSVVVGSKVPVVLEFWSPECTHCRRMANVVDSLAKELAGRYLVAKVNVLENAVTPPTFGVSGLPSFFLLKDGEVLRRTLGAMSKGLLKKDLGI